MVLSADLHNNLRPQSEAEIGPIRNLRGPHSTSAYCVGTLTPLDAPFLSQLLVAAVEPGGLDAAIERRQSQQV
jgi:hypothetical protein